MSLDLAGAKTADDVGDTYRHLIATALWVAKNPAPPDPSSTRLYSWRTAKSPLNADQKIPFMTVAGIDFYTMPPPKAKDSEMPHPLNGPMTYPNQRPGGGNTGGGDNRLSGPMTYPNKRPPK